MNVGDRLRKLLALANRAGTPAESDVARRRAERLARRENLTLVTASTGELIAVEPDRADLLEALDRIINPREPGLLVSAERLGHDFGRTPMGHGQVVEVAARRGREEAATAGSFSVRAATSATCTCDPTLARFGAHNGSCPIHGLVATLRAAGARLREEDAVA